MKEPVYEVGARIWRWRRGYGLERRPAVIVKVSAAMGVVTSVSSKSRADADERPEVHRVTRAGLSGAELMTPRDAERAADIEAWQVLRYLRPVTKRDGVTVTGWTFAAAAKYAEELESGDLVKLRSEIDAAAALLRREQERA